MELNNSFFFSLIGPLDIGCVGILVDCVVNLLYKTVVNSSDPIALPQISSNPLKKVAPKFLHPSNFTRYFLYKYWKSRKEQNNLVKPMTHEN